MVLFTYSGSPNLEFKGVSFTNDWKEVAFGIIFDASNLIRGVVVHRRPLKIGWKFQLVKHIKKFFRRFCSKFGEESQPAFNRRVSEMLKVDATKDKPSRLFGKWIGKQTEGMELEWHVPRSGTKNSKVKGKEYRSPAVTSIFYLKGEVKNSILIK